MEFYWRRFGSVGISLRSETDATKPLIGGADSSQIL